MGQDRTIDQRRQGNEQGVSALAVDPLVSVIVPTCGRPEMLAETLRSIRDQDYQNFEVLVIDDAGTPPADIDWLADARFRLHRVGARGGLARARNLGVQLSQGSVIAFLDDDDLWLPTRLSASLPYLSDADIVVCGAQTLGQPHVNLPRRSGYTHDHILDRTTPSMCQVLIRREAFAPFNPEYLACQDLEWWIRATQTAAVRSAPVAGFIWRKHDGPRTTNGVRARVEFSQRLLIDHRDYFDRHRRAKAFRLRRIAVMAADSGQLRQSLGALWQSGRAWPSWRVIWDLRRCLRLGLRRKRVDVRSREESVTQRGPSDSRRGTTA